MWLGRVFFGFREHLANSLIATVIIIIILALHTYQKLRNMSPGSGLVENVLRHIHPGVEGGTQWRGSALQIDPLKGGFLRHGLGDRVVPFP